jgi:hypothetical protein
MKEKEIPALTADFLTPLTLCPRYVLYNSKVLTSVFCDFLFECCFSDAFLRMPFCRITNFWFLILLFQRKGQFRLILLLLLLKPPRLTKARTEMMPKILERIAALLRRLPLPTLKKKV